MIERTFVESGIKMVELNEFLGKELYRAGFTRAEMTKTPLVTRIIVNVSKPSLAIGKGGQNIRALTETIEKKFKIDNPQLEIREIEVPELNAAVMANRIKSMIERGYSWRSVAYRSMRDITNANAQGVELLLSGKLAGKGGRKRKQRIASGYMKKVGDQVRLVDYAKATAYPKAGAIGIKLRIVRPDVVFPDKVKIEDAIGTEEPEQEMEKAETGASAETKPAEKKEAAKEDKGKEPAEKKKAEAKKKKAKKAAHGKNGKAAAKKKGGKAAKKVTAKETGKKSGE